jgi:hypothetical protein
MYVYVCLCICVGVYKYIFTHIYMSCLVLLVNSREILRKCGLPLTLILQQGNDKRQY